jgi:hypothetical protein
MREGVWTRGEFTELEAWVAGRSRTVVVTREAIEQYLALRAGEAAGMSADERRRFVSGNVALVVAAANRKADATDLGVGPITLSGGEL